VTSVGIAGLAVALLVTMEFLQQSKGHALDVAGRSAYTRWLAYTLIVATIVCFRYTGSALDFIYFQF
jgi:hypothetical protein